MYVSHRRVVQWVPLTVVCCAVIALVMAARGASSLTPRPCYESDTVSVAISGVWRGNDGGTYWIRQIGRCVWWAGASDNSDPRRVGRAFTNVFRGVLTADGRTISGSWSDVPNGATRGSGRLTLAVTGVPIGLVKTNATGSPFGAAAWTRSSARSARRRSGSIPTSSYCRVGQRRQTNLTGMWLGDDGATYWIRQIGSCLWWAGFSGSTTSVNTGVNFSNAFLGDMIDDQHLEGDWVDLPRGQANGSGTLSFRLSRGRLLQLFKTSSSGSGFGARTLTFRLNAWGP
jgi:hypothetical protein